MGVIEFDNLPDSARLWVYSSENEFSPQQAQLLQNKMTQFLHEWTAHKRELMTGWQLQYNRFIMIAVDEAMMAASGCSIDTVVHHLKDVETMFGRNIINTNAKIFYRKKDKSIECISRPEFKQFVIDGDVTENTVVFNNTIQLLGDLRKGLWEVPMKASWHFQAFSAALV